MSSTTRRTFLQSSALSALAATRSWGANDCVNIAVIGIGGRGRNCIEEYARQRGLQTGSETDLAVDGGNCIGNLFYGSKGWMSLDAEGCRIYTGDPAKLTQQAKYEEPKKTDTGPHVTNFLKAVRNRKLEGLHADVNIECISADLCHLANISYRSGGHLLAFDLKAERFADEKANRLAHPSYRAPYVIPHLAS